MPQRETQKFARQEFDDLVRDIRPDLHRYCSRLVGSAIEGEDIVQEALAKAYYQISQLEGLRDVRAWLFRVGHNKAVDYLRRYDNRFGDELPDDVAAPDEGDPVERVALMKLGLSYFTKLTPTQRSCVILKDVLGYSLEQLSEILDLSVPAVKGALHRGRASLRRLASSADDIEQPLALSSAEAERLAHYLEMFNNRDFDRLRDRLADDVRLEVVGRLYARGAEAVGGYFDNYSRAPAYRARVGPVEGRAALIVSDSVGGDYCVLVTWDDDRVRGIRDYRYARHVLAEVSQRRA